MSKLRCASPWVMAVMLAVGIVGCDWEWSGDSSSWSDRYNWVNFSGTYGGASGGLLITDYSTVASSGSSSGTTYYTVSGEGVGAGDGTSTAYAGTLDHGNVVAGSVSIVAGGFSLTDDGAGWLSGGGASGTIDYGTGAWAIDLAGIPLGSGVSIEASYQYTVSNGGSGGISVDPGTSGAYIYSFVVEQEGNTLRLIDNNGAQYEGKMGDITGTSGINQDTATAEQTPTAGDIITGTFEAEGTSAAGFSVKIVGSFQGVVGGSGTAFYLEGRQMTGTWIESGGKTGNINGTAASVAIATTTTTTGG